MISNSAHLNQYNRTSIDDKNKYKNIKVSLKRLLKAYKGVSYHQKFAKIN
jgi:hypothetical protein